MVDVVATFIARRVQPLQQRFHPLWEYNGDSDSTRVIAEDFANQKALTAMLADLFKGEESEFAASSLETASPASSPYEW
jgi:hypothetical protein